MDAFSKQSCLAGLLLAIAASAAGAQTPAVEWQLAAGPTRTEGAAVELARTTSRWDLALGYVSAQRVNVETVQDTCYAQPTGQPDCRSTVVDRQERDVRNYGYVSLQRRFRLLGDRRYSPVFGFGLVGQTDTNPYVSYPVSFSLSLSLRVTATSTLAWRHFSNAGLEQPNLGQDMLLLRWDF